MKRAGYTYIIVESFIPKVKTGHHGEVHARPIEGQGEFLTTMFVSCNPGIEDSKMHPVGTKFRIQAKVTSRNGGTPYVYSHHKWEYSVVD